MQHSKDAQYLKRRFAIICVLSSCMRRLEVGWGAAGVEAKGSLAADAD